MVMILTLYCRVFAQKEKELDLQLEVAEKGRKLVEIRWQEVEKAKAAVEKEKANYEKGVLMHQLECAKLRIVLPISHTIQIR